MDLITVYTTVSTRDQARSIARALVERRLAACVQLEAIESFYVWNGAVADETEWRVLAKTTASRYADVEAAIRSLHPYELPAIHAIAIDRVYEPYGRWVADGSIGDSAGSDDDPGSNASRTGIR